MPNKKDKTLVKSYRIITLLNYFNKVVKKLIVEMLIQFSQTKSFLYKW